MTAMARVTQEMGDGAPTDIASTLTFISQRILEGQPVVEPAAVHNVDGAAATPAAPGLTVVYHQYADRASTVDTPDGPVRVSPEIVERIVDVAQAVTLTAEHVARAEPVPDGELDRPNDSAIARKVRKRDGERCASPGCGTRKSLQAHHIRYREHGGRTVMMNEVALCRTCHTLVHAGLVEVERAATGELRWTARARAGDVEREVKPSPSLAQLMAGVTMPSPPTPVTHLDVDALVEGLTSLGFSQRVARQRLDLALANLARQASDSASGATIDDGLVLKEALRMGGV